MTYVDSDVVEFYRSTSFFVFGGKWRWRRIARNGQIVGASSEAYVNYIDCFSNFQRNLSTNYTTRKLSNEGK